MRRQQLDKVYPGAVGEIFHALGQTLAFRRWGVAAGLTRPLSPSLLLSPSPSPSPSPVSLPLPGTGARYHCDFGSVQRAGRVVEVFRPVGITLKEVLRDPPCRVSLTLRWRIDPGLSGCTVRLRAQYRLNHAAILRASHWERRLQQHFRNQFAFLAVHLARDTEPRKRR